MVSARAETTAAAEASLERAIAAEATAAEALSNAKRSEVARKAAEAAAEAAETRAGEAEARVRVNVAMAAQAEEARKLAESEASEADAKMRALTAKEHVRNEDAIRATDAAVSLCFKPFFSLFFFFLISSFLYLSLSNSFESLIFQCLLRFIMERYSLSIIPCQKGGSV